VPPTRSGSSTRQGLTSFDVTRYFPTGSKSQPDKVSIVGLKLSPDGNMVVAADSDKNIYVFGKGDQGWVHKTSFETDKRTLRIQFDRGNKNLVLVDKTGDVYIRPFEGIVIKLRKILGHCSLILDTVISNDNRLIFTADRDEKIRCSKFPEAHQIEYFLLGHSHAVVGIALFNHDQNMLSIGVDGTIKLWNLQDQKCAKTWNVFQACHGMKYIKPDEHEVKKLKLTDSYGNIYFAVVIDGTKEIPVFELIAKEKYIRQLGQVKMESDYCDVAWQGSVLYTYNPEFHGVLKRFSVSNQGVLCDSEFNVTRIHDFSHDFAAFVAYNQTVVPLRKRISSDLVKTYEGEKIIEDFLAEAEKKIPRLIRNAKSKGRRHPDNDTAEKPETSKAGSDAAAGGPSSSKYIPEPEPKE